MILILTNPCPAGHCAITIPEVKNKSINENTILKFDAIEKILFKVIDLVNIEKSLDKDKAIFFLRRLKEMLFMEKKNINNWENLENAALFSGLDSAVLQKQMKKEGFEDFQDDLELAKELGIRIFPTLIFERNGFETEILKGLKSYEIIEETILKYVPNAKKNLNLPKPEELFKLYNNMTEKEFAFLLNLTQDSADLELRNLQSRGLISKVNVKEVSYWQSQLKLK